jgi:hypothetical protein
MRRGDERRGELDAAVAVDDVARMRLLTGKNF